MGKRVLVTGGAGFIGRRLCRELLEHGYEVRVLDSLVEQAHAGAQKPPLADVDFRKADVRDADAVREALAGVEWVIHLAAEVGVGQSMYEIARYVGANDLGAAVLLEALIAHPVRRVVIASSMSVYGEGAYRDARGALAPNVRRNSRDLRAGRFEPRDAQGGPLTPVPTSETKPVDLASIYALTKYVQERETLIFGEAYGMQAVALRLFNVFGPGQALSNPYTGVLANFAARLLNGEAPSIFEDGAQRRDFVHVNDVARAFRLALEREEAAGETINIGSGRSYAIRDVAAMIARAMGRDVEPEILARARLGDIRHCFADIARAERLLDFAPRHTLEESVGEVAEWVRAQQAQDRSALMRRELEARGLVA